jgi:hypothetical protein
MKKEFKKQLIGRDQVAINQKLDIWQDAISQLEKLAVLWQEYFNEPFVPDLVKNILSTKDVKFLIQVHYIENDLKLSELGLAHRIKIEELVKITDFPDYENLLNEIISFKNLLERKKFCDEFSNCINEIYPAGKYIFPDSIKADIEAKFTYYTRDDIENEALQLIKNLCNSINAINGLGVNIKGNDLPPFLQGCIITGKGEKTFGELGSGAAESKYYVPKLFPNWGMFQREDNFLLYHLRK